MSDRCVLLSIDCDWAVTPTPLRESSLARRLPDEPESTYEHLHYPFDGRPLDARHGMSTTPAGLMAALRAKGLPLTRTARFSEIHSGTREAWHDLLATCAEIVCLDAHLDMFPVGSVLVQVPGPGGRKLEIEYHPTHREMGQGMPKQMVGDAVRQRAYEATWEESWALHLLEFMPRLRRFTWVVPEHFAAGLAAGFPYPHAAWHRLLEGGRLANIWTYELDPAAHRISLHFREPELQGRSLVIDVVTLADCPPLHDVDPEHVHICRSPAFLHPGADAWVDELVRLVDSPAQLAVGAG